MASEASVIRVKPYFYIHVLDNNTNVTRVEVGPQTFTRQDHEKIVAGPDPMIMIPPRNFAIIANPVHRDENGHPILDKNKQAKLRHGDEEIRFEQEPFPLYPGEKLVGKVSPLQVVAPNTALRLRVVRDYTDADGTVRRAGDEYVFEGPGTYIPRIEAQVSEVIRAVIVKPNQALKLRARKGFVDSNKVERQAGEEWLVKTSGAYLPGVDEEVVETISAYTLTEKKALHLRATKTFTDTFKRLRRAGEEWLVTLKDAETHMADVYEQVVGEEKIYTLTNRQFCVIIDPWKDGKPQLGKKELRHGEVSFFLNPGERLEKGIQDIIVLSEDEALLLKAKDTFVEKDKTVRKAGDRWMIRGPADYVPPVEVEVVEKRAAIPLDENEGIYVRDIKTGHVRTVAGESYLLKPNEELWSKELPAVVEEILAKATVIEEGAGERDKTRVVTYRAPHNTAVQIYDYKAKKSRVVFGPELVMLGPDEHFTLLSLSGDKPKRPHVIKAIALQLGPDFFTDVVTVETADHARLSLKLSYNWHFEINKAKAEDASSIFQVPDFVGDACKAVAARVRGAVAGVSFDVFHKQSARIIRAAVFGVGDDNRILDKFKFIANNLVITNIDIQSVEPVDQRTRDSLQKSVQLAIEITTKSQEARARHENARLEQEAAGSMERQKIVDETQAELTRQKLITLQVETAAVESTGQATAEARARAAAAAIENDAAVKQAQQQTEAARIKAQANLAQLRAKHAAEVAHLKALNELEIARAKELAQIETEKFKQTIDAIGADTIVSMAEAGPATQAKLLQGLGLKSFLITDGNSPINLFNTASGLLGGPLQQ